MRFAIALLLLLSSAPTIGKIAHEPPPASEKMASRKPAAWYSWFWRKKPAFDESDKFPDRGNQQKWTFKTATEKLAQISAYNPVTVYCPCTFKGKKVDLKSCGFKSQNDRSEEIEWEHIAAAESFGQSFKFWREGDSKLCVHKGKGKLQGPYKGRRCAKKNRTFRRMESDLYNLWPIIGQLNGLRSNMTMAEISGDSEYDFGGCKVKIQNRKFEPMDDYKGIVARAHKYMEWAYPGHGIISDKNEKLFDAWDKEHPVTDWECQRNDLIEEIQGNPNPIVKEACAKSH